MNIKVALDDLEDKVGEMAENDEFIDCEEIEVFQEEESMMLVDGYVVKLPTLGLEMRSGIMLLLDEDDGEYYPDWGLTAIYEIDSDPKDYLYYEQDGFVVSLFNFLRMQNREDELGSIECIICDE